MKFLITHLKQVIFLAAFTKCSCFVFSQDDTKIIGIWKGTSICQIKNSPCHDELSVCHISKKGNTDSFVVVMNKMVNGVEEDMGVSTFYYNAKEHKLIWVDKTRNAVWEFTVYGDTIKGTATYQGKLYRIIDLKKEK